MILNQSGLTAVSEVTYLDTDDEICDTVTGLPANDDTEPVWADGCLWGYLPCLFCLSGSADADLVDTDDEICDTVTRLPVDDDTEPVWADGCLWSSAFDGVLVFGEELGETSEVFDPNMDFHSGFCKMNFINVACYISKRQTGVDIGRQGLDR